MTCCGRSGGTRSGSDSTALSNAEGRRGGRFFLGLGGDAGGGRAHGARAAHAIAAEISSRVGDAPAEAATTTRRSSDLCASVAPYLGQPRAGAHARRAGVRLVVGVGWDPDEHQTAAAEHVYGNRRTCRAAPLAARPRPRKRRENQRACVAQRRHVACPLATATGDSGYPATL